MYIRKTTENDFQRVMEIYAYARQFMASHGNPNQWGPTCWPPEKLIHTDISLGKSYVCLNDQDLVIGTFFYDFGTDIEPTYREMAEGSWRDNTDFGVVHRIATDGSEKGIGTFCLNWAFEQCGHLKIDTHGDNHVMQSLLKKLGFEQRGIIYVVEDNDPRLAFER